MFQGVFWAANENAKRHFNLIRCFQFWNSKALSFIERNLPNKKSHTKIWFKQIIGFYGYIFTEILEAIKNLPDYNAIMIYQFWATSM